MRMNTHFVLGDWNVICDRCSRKRKRSQCDKTWDNLIVCRDGCWEPRHPQDFARAIADDPSVPDPRPDDDSDPEDGPTITADDL